MSAEQLPTQDVEKLEIHDDVDSTYKPPAEKSLDDLMSFDQHDESLQKYKEKLLGEATSGKIVFGMFL